MVTTKSVGRVIAVVALIGFLGTTTACYGPFNLTKSLYKWNGQIKGSGQVTAKWMQELVFLGLAVLPVYEFALLGDALLLHFRGKLMGGSGLLKGPIKPRTGFLPGAELEEKTAGRSNRSLCGRAMTSSSVIGGRAIWLRQRVMLAASEPFTIET